MKTTPIPIMLLFATRRRRFMNNENMTRLTLFTFLVLVLWACNEKPKGSSGSTIQQTEIETENSKYSSINLQINELTIIDSSDWVLYPLLLREFEETEKGFFKSSSYGYRERVYWNVAFYNTETKQTRLLSDSLKMVIKSISPKQQNGKNQ
jgi:hypothetical protein